MNNWQKALITADTTMEVAIQVIGHAHVRAAIVVDEKQRLLGIVTDGDVRRALLKHFAMDTPVKRIMNANPKKVLAHQDKESVLALMQAEDLLQIPVVDENNKVLAIETLHHLAYKEKFENPVFIMAGGFGKRLRPLTNTMPKSLLKVGKQPLLEHTIEHFISHGFYRFIIATHYRAKQIIDCIGDGSRWGIQIEYLYESAPLGTAGSLSLLSSFAKMPPIIMINGDILTKVNFKNLLHFHQQQNAMITVCVREYDIEVPFGVIEVDGHQITKVIEKPVHRFFVNAGIYILNSECIQFIPKATALDMPDLLQKMIIAKKPVVSFPLHEYWIDIGRESDYEKAHLDYVNEYA